MSPAALARNRPSSPPRERRHGWWSLAKTPWELTAADYKGLEADLGADKAMATFWWLCRGLYMTRVSDGFQLPLERENVFADFYPKNPAGSVPGGTTPK